MNLRREIDIDLLLCNRRVLGVRSSFSKSITAVHGRSDDQRFTMLGSRVTYLARSAIGFAEGVERIQPD
jgi:hypothetical protein